jgi:hypothetical protein
MAQNQWGEEVDQWGNPVSSAQYLPPEYYDTQQSPYVDSGYGGSDPYYSGGAENPDPAQPEQPTQLPYNQDSIPDPSPAGSSPTADPNNPQAYIQSLLSGVGYGAAGLKSLKDKFAAAGYNVWIDANGGARGIITDPQGRDWNVLDPNESMNWWSAPTGTAWNVRQHSAGGGGGTGGGEAAPTVTPPPTYVAPPINPEYLEPFTEQEPTRPDSPTYTPGAFSAPSGDALLANGGYLFRRDQGKKALENNAAARGVLNTGGTLKDFASFGDGLASQEYDNAWNREYSLWNSNEGNKLNAFRANKDVSDTSYNNAWNQYLERRNTFYANQNNPWQKQLDATRVGAGL